MVLFPNAKINIGLNVTEKRNDGFHNIESIFYPVFELYDVLEIVKCEELKFTSTGIEIPGSKKDNLCLKAYQLLKQDFNISPVHIYLLKVIPIGAGLGGGSADAAFTLKGLNDLFDLKLTDEQLISYAQKLGSDCAFFIKNKPVFAFNKGDEFKDIELDLLTFEIKIEYPNIHIGTAEAYAGIHPKEPVKNIKSLIAVAPIENWKETIKNDFEESIFPNHPEIKELKEKMYKNGAVYASMTGSGSAVYGVFERSE
ncbi:4-(cytidine 5'-diphospho)-2-C-methyl-D-erythritol kinase [Vicingus serpentipes]|uniref:4-diphosphocytidyl-2-C-methyl-D-erythritol kinase n=1 Tax=Vicingus serpentipes TaxID=1926625 RepID=A0A5C6RS24_9FLAO|nr:4-(cytidine 5'-diphospho)-2-C-methyl-D-erythritol kinase [Vicingus serpentipes]TXB65098.1 4-(cytidine 5'-diphospho)-2-C-methyl-D-erythritol kinase [Vicingus serpentipes]